MTKTRYVIYEIKDRWESIVEVGKIYKTLDQAKIAAKEILRNKEKYAPERLGVCVIEPDESGLGEGKLLWLVRCVLDYEEIEFGEKQRCYLEGISKINWDVDLAIKLQSILKNENS